jgi:RHS repeat-associated protein
MRISDSIARILTERRSGNTLAFKYDGLNRQVSRTVNGGLLFYSVYDGWNLIAEYQNAQLKGAYLSGSGGLIKNFVTNRYYYQDASGSTSHLASGTGQLQEWYRYDVHGTPTFYNASNVQIGGSAAANNARHLFTGQQWYSELGLYDLRNRFYSPDLGRFLQPDPIGFAGDPSNIYRYVGNNPVNRSDPSGLVSPDYTKYSTEQLQAAFPDLAGIPTAQPVTVVATPIAIDLSNALGGLGGSGGERGGSGGGGNGGNGGSGKDKGKDREKQKDDDCRTMAAIIQALANETNSDNDFLDAVARAFIGARDATIEQMQNAGALPSLGSGQSGFQAPFRETTSGLNDQVRHFAAGFIAGAYGPFAVNIMNQREEPNTPDMALNGVSTVLGMLSTSRSDALGYRRYALAARIRELVCDH